MFFCCLLEGADLCIELILVKNLIEGAEYEKLEELFAQKNDESYHP
ncbi:hypothetical protein JOC77_004205 [Peribacillus deserti]|uniref:Uncharacterized protein n=1 Tax=Peribacillus deserti TaxID=673318 RepID=A0ABS2QNI5_9BACI|nr:hypothetical protein [Peribacillus deserti]